jgi:hypothetical protein
VEFSLRPSGSVIILSSCDTFKVEARCDGGAYHMLDETFEIITVVTKVA